MLTSAVKKRIFILRRKNNNLIKNIKRAVLSYLPVNFRQISVFLAFFCDLNNLSYWPNKRCISWNGVEPKTSVFRVLSFIYWLKGESTLITDLHVWSIKRIICGPDIAYVYGRIEPFLCKVFPIPTSAPPGAGTKQWFFFLIGIYVNMRLSYCLLLVGVK